MSANTKGRTEIQITNVSPNIKRDLKIIAKNKGTTITDMLRPFLIELLDKNKQFLINHD